MHVFQSCIPDNNPIGTLGTRQASYAYHHDNELYLHTYPLSLTMLHKNINITIIVLSISSYLMMLLDGQVLVGCHIIRISGMASYKTYPLHLKILHMLTQ